MKARSGMRQVLRVFTDRRGAIAVLAGLMGLPMAYAVGLGIDYAQMVQGETALQDAVDNAALAGATVYATAAQSATAGTVASSYFNSAALPKTLSVAAPVVTAASGTTNFQGSAYNVTVTASATITPPFLGIIQKTFTLTASATASNPIITISVNKSSPGTSLFSSSAWDWNSIWMYPVPMSNGKPVYNSFPALSQFYEVGTNCTSASAIYNSSSRCNGQYGATLLSGQTIPTFTATQPFGFVLANMTFGLKPSSYTAVAPYNQQSGNINWFYSVNEAQGLPPSQGANYSYSVNGKTVTTSYPTASTSAVPNCSLQIGKLSSASAMPPKAPYSGACFAGNNTASGYQYAGLTCAMINGDGYGFWWNDMGGVGTDDKDYNDAVYALTCTVSGNSGTGNSQVTLTN